MAALDDHAGALLALHGGPGVEARAVATTRALAITDGEHTGPRAELRWLFVLALVRAESRATVCVATAAADTGNLRFYQRLGFRLRSVERDAFTPEADYESGLQVDGIPLRDRVWLDLRL